jgi:hypothetical protein
MLAPAHISRTALAVAALSVAGGCADDPQKIAQAQSACIRMAREHLAKQAVSGEPTFADDVANVMSDPEPDAFEFRWLVVDRTLQWNPPEAGKAVEGVFCKGYAGKKVVTGLVVGNYQLQTPRSY